MVYEVGYVWNSNSKGYDINMRLLVSAVMAFFFLAGCSYTIGKNEVFHPRRKPIMPDDVDRKNEELTLQDGTLVRGWYLTVEKPRGALVFFYGNMDRLVKAIEKLCWLASSYRLNILAYDYPGFGFSEGTPTVANTLEFSLLVYDSMRERWSNKAQPIIVFGHSLGAEFASWVGAKRPDVAVILEAPFLSVQAYVDHSFSSEMFYPWYVRWFVSPQIEEELNAAKQPIDLVPLIQGPLLIIHSKDDPITPLSFAEKLYTAANSPQNILCVSETGHHFPLRPSTYLHSSTGIIHANKKALTCLGSFLDDLLGAPIISGLN
jgi:pimeloyl-ACP methyl ester carboxylesterase